MTYSNLVSVLFAGVIAFATIPNANAESIGGGAPVRDTATLKESIGGGAPENNLKESIGGGIAAPKQEEAGSELLVWFELFFLN